MKYILSVFGLMMFSLTGCSVDKSFSEKTFNAVDELSSVEKINRIECSKIYKFENIPFEQKCWEVTVADNDRALRLGIDVATAVLKPHGYPKGKLIKPSTSESELSTVIRLKTQDDCADYIGLNYSDPNAFEEKVVFPVTIEITVTSTKVAYCGKLSKVY